MRTQVVIIGAGPAGLLLSQLLFRAGVDCVVLENRSRAYVEGRIRAGVLEPGTVALLNDAGVGARLSAEGLLHDGFGLLRDGELLRIDLKALSGAGSVTVYGQTEITRDLIDAHVARGTALRFEVDQVMPHDIASDHPFVTFVADGVEQRIACDFIAGCDGFHGVSRGCIPADVLRTFERVYPFGWLGILADVPPCHHEIVYASHARGFALASMRSRTRSRYYLQCAVDEPLDAWPDERIWDEVAERLGPELASQMTRGPALEKSIAPLRSFVAEPMRHGRLFLVGDAAHIVPPTGAKGLNLAASDVRILAEGLIAFYGAGSSTGIDNYSRTALEGVWTAERFSWWLTNLTHRFPDADGFAERMQQAEFRYLGQSRAAAVVVAENYVGHGR